jgi:hypothetical protein
MKKYKIAMAALVWLSGMIGGVNTTQAAFVSGNSAIYGTGAFTLDTSTNLQWLDLSVSQGQTYNFVSSQLGSNGIYSGFRYATYWEVYYLVQNFELFSSSRFQAAQNLFSYLGTGATQIQYEWDWENDAGMLATYEFLEGTIANTSYLGSHRTFGVGACYEKLGGTCGDGGRYTTTMFSGYSWDSSPSFHWLVRTSPVPVPPSIWLMISGLVAFYGRFRLTRSA